MSKRPDLSLIPDDDGVHRDSSDHFGLGWADGNAGKTYAESDSRLFDQQTGIYHGLVADHRFTAGLYGEPGERRVGIDTEARALETDYNFGQLISEDALLNVKLVTGHPVAKAYVGEDGANFAMGVRAAELITDFGTIDPDSNHDVQGKLGVTVGVGLPSASLAWGDVDEDGYREFGGKFSIPIVPGLSVTLGLRIEIGISDQDFRWFGAKVEDGFEDFEYRTEAAFNDFGDDANDAFKDFGHDVDKGFKDFGRSIKNLFT